MDLIYLADMMDPIVLHDSTESIFERSDRFDGLDGFACLGRFDPFG